MTERTVHTISDSERELINLSTDSETGGKKSYMRDIYLTIIGKRENTSPSFNLSPGSSPNFSDMSCYSSSDMTMTSCPLAQTTIRRTIDLRKIFHQFQSHDFTLSPSHMCPHYHSVKDTHVIVTPAPLLLFFVHALYSLCIHSSVHEIKLLSSASSCSILTDSLHSIFSSHSLHETFFFPTNHRIFRIYLLRLTYHAFNLLKNIYIIICTSNSLRTFVRRTHEKIMHLFATVATTRHS